MSDTPRTDAAATISICSGVEMVRPGFARELERENARLREALQKITLCTHTHEARLWAIEALAAQNAGVADTAACRERVTQETASSVPPAPDLVKRMPDEFDDPYKPVPHDERKMLLSRIEALERRVAELERELRKWEAPFDPEKFEAAKQQASHGDSLAAQGVYITALEHALKHAERRVAELERAYEIVERDAKNLSEKVIPNIRERAEQDAARLIAEVDRLLAGPVLPTGRYEDGWNHALTRIRAAIDKVMKEAI